MSRRSRDSQRDQSLTPIFLILGLVLGIPAVIGVGVLVVIFLLGLFVVRAANEVKAEVEAAQVQGQRHLEQLQQEFPPPNLEKKLKKPFVPPAPPVGVPGKPMYDLIGLIDVQKDANEKHKWEVVNNELRCKEGSFVPRVEIPYQPPAEYDFIVTFSQPGLRNGISMIMPNPNGGSFFWFLGSEDGSAYGLHSNPNLGGNKQGLVQANVACTTTVQVRRDRVRCLVDGVEKLNVKTNFKELTSDNWREIKDNRLLAVAADDPAVFHFIRIVEITGKGKRMR